MTDINRCSYKCIFRRQRTKSPNQEWERAQKRCCWRGWATENKIQAKMECESRPKNGLRVPKRMVGCVAPFIKVHSLAQSIFSSMENVYANNGPQSSNTHISRPLIKTDHSAFSIQWTPFMCQNLLLFRRQTRPMFHDSSGTIQPLSMK